MVPRLQLLGGDSLTGLGAVDAREHLLPVRPSFFAAARPSWEQQATSRTFATMNGTETIVQTG